MRLRSFRIAGLLVFLLPQSHPGITAEPPATKTGPRRPVVALLGFEDRSGHSELSLEETRLRGQLVESLIRYKGVRLLSRNAVNYAYRQMDRKPLSPPSDRPNQPIGRRRVTGEGRGAFPRLSLVPHLAPSSRATEPSERGTPRRSPPSRLRPVASSLDSGDQVV